MQWKDLPTKTKNVLEHVENVWTGVPQVVKLPREDVAGVEYLNGPEGEKFFKILEYTQEHVYVTIADKTEDL